MIGLLIIHDILFIISYILCSVLESNRIWNPRICHPKICNFDIVIILS